MKRVLIIIGAAAALVCASHAADIGLHRAPRDLITTLTLTRTIVTDSYCYVTKNKGPLGDKEDKKKGVLGGKPLIGPLVAQKGTTQCGKARAIETSSIRGLDAADKLLISPSAASSPESASRSPGSHRQGRPFNLKLHQIAGGEKSFTDLFKPDLNLYVLTKTETSTTYEFRATTTVTFECTPKTSILQMCPGGAAPFDFIPKLGLGAPALPFVGR